MKKPAITIALALLSVGILPSCHKKAVTYEDRVGPATEVSLNLPDTTSLYYGKFKIATDLPNEKATLGRVLFYDKQLSVNNSVACASCHKQELAFADNMALSRGYENRLTGRNSMPIQNLFTRSSTSFGDPLSSEMTSRLFWDGRSGSVMDLVLRPVSNHVEMGIADPETLAAKLSGLSYYKPLFKKAFGSEIISVEHIRQALTMFVCAINADSTRYDQYLKTREGLNALEMEGERLFTEKYACSNCHQLTVSGYYSSIGFFDIGLDEIYRDKGAGAISMVSEDYGKFRMPNLRNIALTAPYMHDGRFKTLNDVLDHYSKGIKKSPNLDWQLMDTKQENARKMNISEDEKRAIIAFLNTLTDYHMISDPKFSNPFIAN